MLRYTKSSLTDYGRYQIWTQRTLGGDWPLFSKKDSSAEVQAVAACAGRRASPAGSPHHTPAPGPLPTSASCRATTQGTHHLPPHSRPTGSLAALQTT